MGAEARCFGTEFITGMATSFPGSLDVLFLGLGFYFTRGMSHRYGKRRKTGNKVAGLAANVAISTLF